ncbi:MAG: ROK family protein, partial [Verrucomicrobiota bacterium]
TQDFDGAETLIDAIIDRIAEMRNEHPEISAIGVGVPGAVDFAEGMTYNLTNVKGWSSVPLRDIMVERTGLPTVVENDANCMAFAEWKFGAGQGYRNVVCVTLGTGVGGGLILGGDIFRGSQYAAGEIGQMSIDLEGKPGPYGNSGALERYIGNRQIEQLAVEIYREHGRTPPETTTPEILSELAREGDEIAILTWQRVADCLANCLMSVVYLLNPDAIVIGGGVAYAGPTLLFDPLRERLKQSLTPECFDHLAVVPARFGNTAGILGCSAMAAELGR